MMKTVVVFNVVCGGEERSKLVVSCPPRSSAEQIKKSVVKDNLKNDATDHKKEN